MPKRLIIIHIKSWQSVRSLTNPKCKCVMFLCTIFNIVVKIVIFFKEDTCTQISSVQDEGVI